MCMYIYYIYLYIWFWFLEQTATVILSSGLWQRYTAATEYEGSCLWQR